MELYVDLVLPAFMAALSGRTWDGKGDLFKGFVTICIACKNAIIKNDEWKDQIAEVKKEFEIFFSICSTFE